PSAPARATVAGPAAGPAAGPVAGPTRGRAAPGRAVPGHTVSGRALPGVAEPPRLAPVQHRPARRHSVDAPLQRLPSSTGGLASAQLHAAVPKRAVQPEYDERP